MPRILTILSILAVSLYTAVMGYSVGVVSETDATAASAFLRGVTRRTIENYAPHAWKVWRDGSYGIDAQTYEGYAIMYPRDFDADDAPTANVDGIGTQKVRLSFPSDAYVRPVSTYVDAWMTVSVADDVAGISRCHASPAGDGTDLANAVTLGENTFYRTDYGVVTDAGRTDRRIYRLLRANRCYDIALNVRTRPLAEGESEGAAFDVRRALRVMERAVETLHISNEAPAS